MVPGGLNDYLMHLQVIWLLFDRGEGMIMAGRARITFFFNKRIVRIEHQCILVACSAGAEKIVYDRGLLLLVGLVREKYYSGWKITIVYDQANRPQVIAKVISL